MNGKSDSDKEFQSSVLNDAFGNLGEEWELLYSQGNYIYATKTRIAKIARTQDEEWVEHGLNVAIHAGANGISAVQPLIKEIVDTKLGKATLWPRVPHRRVNADTLTILEADLLGTQIGLISKLNYGQTKPWIPFHRLDHRLEITRFPKEIIKKLETLISIVSELVPPKLLDSSRFSFAHADAHLGNMLFNDDGVHVIDFDTANWYPRGWDMACLYNHIALENGNHLAFNALLAAYSVSGGTLSEDTNMLCLLKALRSTTYGITLAPTVDRIEAINNRLNVIQAWVETDDVPVTLPNFSYFD